MTEAKADSIIISGLKHTYPARSGAPAHEVLRGVDLELPFGSITGLVGESGCGKSTLGRFCVGLGKADAGSITLPDGTDINHASGAQLRKLRPSLQMIFQDPYTSFDPNHRLQDAFLPLLERLRPQLSKAEVRELVEVSFERVSLDPGLLRRGPRRLSGGQLQRAAIARALLCRPQVLVADEIISALDLPIQDEILEVLGKIELSWPCAVLFISHDLSAVAAVCQRVAVMADGQIVETGPTKQVLEERQSETTRLLFEAVPHFPF